MSVRRIWNCSFLKGSYDIFQNFNIIPAGVILKNALVNWHIISWEIKRVLVILWKLNVKVASELVTHAGHRTSLKRFTSLLKKMAVFAEHSYTTFIVKYLLGWFILNKINVDRWIPKSYLYLEIWLTRYKNKLNGIRKISSTVIKSSSGSVYIGLSQWLSMYFWFWISSRWIEISKVI